MTAGRSSRFGRLERLAFGQRLADEESITQEVKDVADWA